MIIFLNRIDYLCNGNAMCFLKDGNLIFKYYWDEFRLSRDNSTPIYKQTWANNHTSVWIHPKHLTTHQLHTFPVATHLAFILVSGNGDWTYSVFLKHIHCIISKYHLTTLLCCVSKFCDKETAILYHTTRIKKIRNYHKMVSFSRKDQIQQEHYQY